MNECGGADFVPPEAQPASLGARLREQEIARARPGPDAVRERSAMTPEQYEANAETIRTLFALARANVEHAVASDRRVEPVEMEDLPPFVFSTGANLRLPNNPRHAYYHVYVEAEAWAQENDLELRFEYHHDGGGMRSWYTVSYVPRGEQ